MDTIQHAYAPALAVYAATGDLVQAGAAGAIAAMPDTVEWAEKKFRKEISPWYWYEVLHSNKAVFVALMMGAVVLFGTVMNLPRALAGGESVFGALYPCLFFYGYAVHPILDRFTHGSGKRWWVFNERFWCEVLAWIVLILLAAFVSIWFAVAGFLVLAFVSENVIQRANEIS